MTKHLVLALSILLLPAVCRAETNILDRVVELEQHGKFKEAKALLNSALEVRSSPSPEQKRMRFELDRLERIRKDFPQTREELFAELKQSVKNLTQEEYDSWIREGRFDSREIDGVVYFMSSSVSNLFFRHPELGARRIPPKNTAAFEKAVWESARAITKAATEQKKPYVLPKRFHVTMTVSAKPNAAPAGETIRAWLPIPRSYPFQGDFELVSSSPKLKHLDEPGTPIRSAHFEQTASSDKPTEFKIEYNYTTHGVKFDVDPNKVQPCDPADVALKRFVGETAHVVFTPEMRALSRQIAGEEKNPYLKAKKFYEWIAGQIKYSYAIEYSTIRNISDYCRTRQYGDCGQEALLFITLCRLNGIPARWQSGWNTFPGGKTIHDWSEIYVAPYGWMPVDPYMGIYATRYVQTLTAAQKQEIRDFYFGGLDQYRMAANSDHSQTLSPPKQSMRSDDVDFQRGELEWGDQNIYFDQYSWKLEREEIKLIP
jgi:transglutaminase-like putative cysteine protease